MYVCMYVCGSLKNRGKKSKFLPLQNRHKKNGDYIVRISLFYIRKFAVRVVLVMINLNVKGEKFKHRRIIQREIRFLLIIKKNQHSTSRV